MFLYFTVRTDIEQTDTEPIVFVDAFLSNANDAEKAKDNIGKDQNTVYFTIQCSKVEYYENARGETDYFFKTKYGFDEERHMSALHVKNDGWINVYGDNDFVNAEFRAKTSKLNILEVMEECKRFFYNAEFPKVEVPQLPFIGGPLKPFGPERQIGPQLPFGFITGGRKRRSKKRSAKKRSKSQKRSLKKKNASKF